MRILLIQPTYSYDPNADRYFQFPLGLLTLASYLRSQVPSVDIKIADFELSKRCGIQRKKLFSELINDEWDLIGITSHYNNFSEALAIAEEIKRVFKTTPILLGGVHATVCHKQILDNYNYIDAVIRGEGEEPLLQIVQNIVAGKNFSKGVGSCTYRDASGEIVVSPEVDLLDLLDYPEVDYSLINIGDYISHKEFAKRVWVESGRGCKFKCRFCSSPIRWRHKARYFSIHKVVSELRHLRSNGISAIFFTHDQFLADKAVASQLCANLKEFRGALDWTCYARVDSLSDSTIQMLGDASCGSVFIGFESIVPELQTEVAKKFTQNAALNVIRKCIKNNIRVKGNFIFNLPGATSSTFESDVSFILELKRLGVDNIQTSYLKLYPGADFFDKYQWHDQMNVKHDQLSRGSFLRAKNADRSILFAYLFSDEKLLFCDIPAHAIREVTGCLVEFFPLTLGYLKVSGHTIWSVVESICRKESDFLDAHQYDDYELWLQIIGHLRTISPEDVCLDQMLIYEEALGKISLLEDVSISEATIDVDVENFVENGRITLHKKPRKYTFTKDNDSLTIEEESYE